MLIERFLKVKPCHSNTSFYPSNYKTDEEMSPVSESQHKHHTEQSEPPGVLDVL